MNLDNRASLPAILLAAGRGKRLAPLTDDRPKAMLEIGGEPLAARTLRLLGDAGVDRVVIVGGHQVERLADLGGEVRVNPRYDTADNIYSLYLARDVVESGCLIVNSDVLFGAPIATKLATGSGTFVLCDDSRPAGAEAMKVIAPDGLVKDLTKYAQSQDAVGEYIGLTRVDPAHGAELATVLEDFIVRDDVHVYYEEALVALAKRKPVRVESIGADAWIEIDDHEDLARAQREIAELIET